MSWLESVAALLGVANVLLIARRSIWNFPVGMLMVVLYAKVFFDARLYADAALQAYFFAIQIYGWWHWQSGLREEGEIAVSVLSNPQRVLAVGATLVLSAGIGIFLASRTDAAAPYLDALVAGLSITAQWLLSIRRIESWYFWIAVNILGVWLFASRGLYPTTALYALFLIIDLYGLRRWLRAVNLQKVGETHPR
ncbi:MAG TPA: nicotinamide riboside transporter PnuC [Micropepsaceae bacterium]|nr:nicotinamide riboside transporter PnuC [Micropepsaceae bacterium]